MVGLLIYSSNKLYHINFKDYLNSYKNNVRS
jgi:hypothetical protein